MLACGAWTSACGGRGHVLFSAVLTVMAVVLAGATQIHAWAHDATAPRPVRWLQRRGILLSRDRHARHHAGAHDQSYGIVNGWANGVLDRARLFRHLETLVGAVECWFFAARRGPWPEPQGMRPQSEPPAWGNLAAVASAALGAVSVAVVLCFWFPAQLTTPELRAIYPMTLVRALLQTTIALAFVLGLLGLHFAPDKRLALLGTLLALLATLLGGASVPVAAPVAISPHLGLDWFLLDLFLLAIVYVPLERLFPRVRQPVAREGFATDLVYFFVNHVLVHVLLFLAIMPAAVLLDWARYEPLARAVRSQPLVLQVAEIVVVADFFQYWIHRLFHEVPLLWRVHAIHHSSKRLDWLAGSRLHLVDIVVVRAVTFAPLFVGGFSGAAIRAYAVLVAVAGVFLHANVRFRFAALEKIVATPRYHAFHHAADAGAVDKNFAFHLPILDRLFGTQYLPEASWPERYGIEGDPVPEGWWRQLWSPLRKAAAPLD
jgi:lathosterol oxidase